MKDKQLESSQRQYKLRTNEYWSDLIEGLLDLIFAAINFD